MTKKNLLFRVENANGKSIQEYLKIAVSLDPLPPTITTSFTFNGQALDTLPYSGGPVVVKVVFANGFLYLNGIAYENSPATFNFTITETKTYDFKVVGIGGEISLPFTVPVYVPTEQELMLYNNAYPWVLTKLEESPYSFNGPWNEFGGFLGTKMTFYLSPKKLKAEYPPERGIPTG